MQPNKKPFTAPVIIRYQVPGSRHRGSRCREANMFPSSPKVGQRVQLPKVQPNFLLSSTDQLNCLRNDGQRDLWCRKELVFPRVEDNVGIIRIARHRYAELVPALLNDREGPRIVVRHLRDLESRSNPIGLLSTPKIWVLAPKKPQQT